MDDLFCDDIIAWLESLNVEEVISDVKESDTPPNVSSIATSYCELHPRLQHR